MEDGKEPHLTPRKLVGERFGPDAFGGIRIALMGFCPPPACLERYRPQRPTDQHFIHVSPDSVRILSHGGLRLLSLAHVYGGPVSSATVEELAYYGIDVILAYGLAGGLGTRDLKMGDTYLVADSLSADGTTRHYVAERIVAADEGLAATVHAAWSENRAARPMMPVRAATGDAIYREDDAMLDGFRRGGCDVVNLDSAHLYAVARRNAEGRLLRAVQCGVISDVIASERTGGAESTLSAMLAEGAEGLNPMRRVDDIVGFYVERLAARL